MSEGRVLLVDDEPEFAEVLAKRLEARGFDVVLAEDGTQAVALCEGADFDAIVLDMVMPGMDGIETLRVLKAARDDLEVILLTGQALPTSGVEAIALGALDFLEKPADFEVLLARIRQAKATSGSARGERTRRIMDALVDGGEG